MSIDAAIIQGKLGSESDGNGRGDERVRLLLEVPGSIGPAKRIKVLIHNLSVSGLLLETDFALTMGQQFLMTLPEVGDVIANVVWRSGALAGCSFEQPLSVGALSSVRLRHPLPTRVMSSQNSQIDLQPTSLANRLQQLRKKNGLSRAQLSKLSGISTPTIWAWETGKTVPRRANLLAVAEALGVSAEKIVALEADHFETDGSELSKFNDHSLTDAVLKTKEHLARIAGVSPSDIKINIEY